MLQPIQWMGDHILILDQTKLPSREEYLKCMDIRSVADAIKHLSIRGAPAIGVAAALAIAMEMQKVECKTFDQFWHNIEKHCGCLLKTRPTAVNLQWALRRLKDRVSRADKSDIEGLKKVIEDEALKIFNEDIEANKKIGFYGKALVPDGATVMTHCNTGCLATAGYGTALGVVRAAVEARKRVFVVSCETRPLLQGCRLTSWELKKSKIPFVLITDSTAGYYMKKKKVDLVIIGADRIAANGDTANKVGSYSLAILAKEHKIPFYIAAPLSTIDFSIGDGGQIPIEERDEEEVTCIGSVRIAPEGIKVWNPAFDMVPNAYIEGIITEHGIVRRPFLENLRKWKEKQ